MLTVSNEYGIYLYSEKVDMRKGIDGLCGIVRSQMGLSPFKSKSIFVFGGKNPRAKKVLVREYNRFELISIRLDEGRFISPDTDPSRRYGQISWCLRRGPCPPACPARRRPRPSPPGPPSRPGRG